MNFLIDIGNTRVKWACEKAGRLYAHGAVFISEISEKQLQIDMGNISRPSSIWISNVGSAFVLDKIMAFLEKRYDVQPTPVQVSKRSCGIFNNYQDIESLGVDRWIAAIGARCLVEKGNVIVIDAGTAITIDWLSADNTYEGGVILPGTKLMHDSLVGNTAKIDSSFMHRDRIIGTTTSECVNSGVGFGLGGAVDRIVEQISEEIIKNTAELPTSSDNELQKYNREIEVVATGGGSCSIKSHSIDRAIVEPNLVLIGLQRIARAAQEFSS